MLMLSPCQNLPWWNELNACKKDNALDVERLGTTLKTVTPRPLLKAHPHPLAPTILESPTLNLNHPGTLSPLPLALPLTNMSIH